MLAGLALAAMIIGGAFNFSNSNASRDLNMFLLNQLMGK